MLIYNTTFHVTGERTQSLFLDFMRDVYIPKTKVSSYLRNTRFVSLITGLGDNVSGYALMSEVENIADLKHWKKEKEEELLSLLYQRLGEGVLTFSTAMKIMDL